MFFSTPQSSLIKIPFKGRRSMESYDRAAAHGAGTMLEMGTVLGKPAPPAAQPQGSQDAPSTAVVVALPVPRSPVTKRTLCYSHPSPRSEAECRTHADTQTTDKKNPKHRALPQLSCSPSCGSACNTQVMAMSPSCSSVFCSLPTPPAPSRGHWDKTRRRQVSSSCTSNPILQLRAQHSAA